LIILSSIILCELLVLRVIANGIGKRVSGKCVCAVCQGLAKLRCSACKNVWYCGKEHQKEDWKIHKAKCEFFSNDIIFALQQIKLSFNP
jgi:hypothetical protein